MRDPTELIKNIFIEEKGERRGVGERVAVTETYEAVDFSMSRVEWGGSRN